MKTTLSKNNEGVNRMSPPSSKLLRLIPIKDSNRKFNK